MYSSCLVYQKQVDEFCCYSIVYPKIQQNLNFLTVIGF